MIIVLKGADASTKNIGKIELPHEISEETTAIVNAYGKSLSDTQLLALDNFIIDLNESGIKNKMRGIWLPMLASSLDKAILNIVDNFSAVLPSESRYTLDEYGLKDILSSESSANILQLNMGEDIKASDVFTGTYYADKTKAYMGWSTTGNFTLSRQEYGTGVDAMVGEGSTKLGGTSIATIFGTVNVGGMLYGGLYKTDIGACVLNIKDSKLITPTTTGNAVEINKVNDTDLTSITWSGLKLGYNRGVSVEQGASILMFGQGLTKEQLWALDSSVTKLFKAFGWVE